MSTHSLYEAREPVMSANHNGMLNLATQETKNKRHRMKYTRIALLAAATLWATPTIAHAQGADEEAEEVSGDEGEFDESEFSEDGFDDDVDEEEFCKLDPDACRKIDMVEQAKKPLPETVKAVQQRFILKRHRVELQPFWGFTFNDQFVGHPGPGLGVNFYINEVMAVGLSGQYYINQEQAFNAQVRRAARVGVPLTKYQWQAAANFTYVPANGKFAGFRSFIFHYDVYVVGGIGAISTRPIPVIDPDNRSFDYKPKISFNAGLGLKIFVNRYIAVSAELRDYIFVDQLESTTIDEDNPTDEATWIGDSSLTNNVQAQLGLSVFVPFSFDYRLPKAGADTTGAAQ
ncbi:MAG: outer membrane beta-barrel domain-containing protein [Polyangiaceae bacterium]|nr:outer membrane beta-barrel domain-containing protein [Polyangiaceae bacterium]